jgi:CubicO group peptidase (beta-lactamase class C family)
MLAPLARRFLTISAVAMLVPATASLAIAQGSNRPNFAPFQSMLDSWINGQNLQRGTITVRHQGRIVLEYGVGGDEPKRPRHLASLSKAITAACAANLVDEGKLSFETTLRTALRSYFATRQPPSDTRILDVTVGQLITHRSGLAGNRNDNEVSTFPGLGAYLPRRGTGVELMPIMQAAAINQGLRRAPGDSVYSNDGYLILGLVISEITGEPYDAACRKRVLSPNGAEGRLDPAWPFMGPYGGWSLSGASYLAFLDGTFGSTRVLRERARTWHLDSSGKSLNNGPVWYGLGLFVRTMQGSHNVWHAGSWRSWYQVSGQSPRVEANFNTFAVRYGAKNLSIFVSFEPRVEEAELRKLDAALWKAIREVLPR